MLKKTGSEPPVRRPVLLLLAAAGALSFASAASIPHDGLHPLALMASLLPLQLAALLYVFRRPYSS
jgi:hypothetical protein